MIVRSEQNWKTKSGVNDRNNLRFIDFEDWQDIQIGNHQTIVYEGIENINDLKNIKPKNLICSFLEDYIIERYWNSPYKHVETFKQSAFCMTPDFSLLVGMPVEIINWQIYRTRFIGHLWQTIGIPIIPTVSWSDNKSFPYICNNIAHGSNIAISNVGCRSGEQKRFFDLGLNHVLKELNPQSVIFQCNTKFEREYRDSKFHFIKPFWERKRHGRT